MLETVVRQTDNGEMVSLHWLVDTLDNGPQLHTSLPLVFIISVLIYVDK